MVEHQQLMCELEWGVADERRPVAGRDPSCRQSAEAAVTASHSSLLAPVAEERWEIYGAPLTRDDAAGTPRQEHCGSPATRLRRREVSFKLAVTGLGQSWGPTRPCHRGPPPGSIATQCSLVG
jgi:hypothetical protein